MSSKKPAKPAPRVSAKPPMKRPQPKVSRPSSSRSKPEPDAMDLLREGVERAKREIRGEPVDLKRKP